MNTHSQSLEQADRFSFSSVFPGHRLTPGQHSVHGVCAWDRRGRGGAEKGYSRRAGLSHFTPSTYIHTIMLILAYSQIGLLAPSQVCLDAGGCSLAQVDISTLVEAILWPTQWLSTLDTL